MGTRGSHAIFVGKLSSGGVAFRIINDTSIIIKTIHLNNLDMIKGALY